jgi:hypothetical protein
MLFPWKAMKEKLAEQEIQMIGYPDTVRLPGSEQEMMGPDGSMVMVKSKGIGDLDKLEVDRLMRALDPNAPNSQRIRFVLVPEEDVDGKHLVLMYTVTVD